MMLALSVLAAAHAFAASGEEIAGTYHYKHDVAFLSYSDEKSCQADGGNWNEESLCIFTNSDDSVEVVPAAEGKYHLKIDTVTTNAHTCTFDESAERQGDKLVSKTTVDTWDAEKGKPGEGTCTVTVSFPSANHARVEASPECQSYCGMNASLEIESAERAGQAL